VISPRQSGQLSNILVRALSARVFALGHPAHDFCTVAEIFSVRGRFLRGVE
jgi:hypothetical protein